MFASLVCECQMFVQFDPESTPHLCRRYYQSHTSTGRMRTWHAYPNLPLVPNTDISNQSQHFSSAFVLISKSFSSLCSNKVLSNLDKRTHKLKHIYFIWLALNKTQCLPSHCSQFIKKNKVSSCYCNIVREVWHLYAYKMEE